MIIEPSSLLALPPALLLVLAGLTATRDLFLLIGLIVTLRGSPRCSRQEIFIAYARGCRPRHFRDRSTARRQVPGS